MRVRFSDLFSPTVSPPSPAAGIVSLISLAVLSYERYCTIVASTMASNRDYGPVLGGICFSWFYSLAWTVPPLLGWSRYGPEGPGTTCSVDWRTQTPNNISYIVCLFLFCLLLPFCVILFSYGKLLHTIRQVSWFHTSAAAGTLPPVVASGADSCGEH